MQIAPPPASERVRLEELWAYGVLDTVHEQAYDDITELASTICETPIALVSLVDEDRQWFKSKVGLAASETSRDLAFCAHAILEPEELLIVSDAAEDRRFANNPLVTGDPRIRFYAGAPLVTPSGEALGTLCVIDREPRELTERQATALAALSRQVMAQLELRRALRDLQAFAEDMQRYHEQLHDKSEELRRLYHTVSHELKTPLTAAREFIALLIDGVGGPLTDVQEEYLDTARSCCDQLAVMLNNWLERVRSETGKLKLNLEPVSIPELLCSGCRTKYEMLASRRNLRFDWDIDPSIPATPLDRQRLEQVLGNLVSNAVKFTPDGGTITIRAERRGRDAILSVEDTGRGIEPGHLEQIFNPFYQAEDADAAKKGGIGLGLYICRTIIELHGGRLDIESEPGAGTRVIATLPLETSPAAQLAEVG